MQCLVVDCFVLVCPLQHQHLRALRAAASASGMHVCVGTWLAAPGVQECLTSCQLPCCAISQAACWLQQPLSDLCWMCADCWLNRGSIVSSSYTARCRHALKGGRHAHLPAVQGSWPHSCCLLLSAAAVGCTACLQGAATDSGQCRLMPCLMSGFDLENLL